MEIKYKRLLEIARKMHLWIFLNSGDDYKIYEELGLTDEENLILGSGVVQNGKVCFVNDEEEEKMKKYVIKIEDRFYVKNVKLEPTIAFDLKEADKYEKDKAKKYCDKLSKDYESLKFTLEEVK